VLNSYNNIARSYSTLARIVYGDKLNQAKLTLVQTLPKHGNLLMIGGGNGEVLQAIFNHAPLLCVTYLEASDTMIVLAQKNSPAAMSITFEHSDSFEYAQVHIDAIYAAFFFDLFSPSKADEIIRLLEKKHTNKPTWHVGDFNLQGVDKWRITRKIQIKASILFFRLFTYHPYKKLPLVFQSFQKNGYISLFTSNLENNFLCIEVFKKQ
jgi:hypothetical protein